jgi:hypothetical protein
MCCSRTYQPSEQLYNIYASVEELELGQRPLLEALSRVIGRINTGSQWMFAYASHFGVPS